MPILITLGILLVVAAIVFTIIIIKKNSYSEKVSILEQKEEEIPEALTHFIEVALSKNVSKQKIRSELIAKGWPSEKVDRAFKQVKN